MSDMKCPFCQQWLIPCIQNQNDWIYHCDNPKCPMYDDADIENAKHPLASEDLWQELIRTRTALEIIKKEMSKETMPDFAVISDALKTALEQKDVK